jgi:hypothetical protein
MSRKVRRWGIYLKAQLRMRSQPNESQSVLIRLFVDQDQIRFDVAIAAALPIACQGIIAHRSRERRIFGQFLDNHPENIVKNSRMAALEQFLEIAPE